jgi:hypothetical protein
MNEINIFIDKKIINNTIKLSASIEYTNKKQQHLWYEMPLEYGDKITDKADPFVIATIFLAMETKSKLIVHGEVSQSLIDNLREFQLAWNCWKPHQYYPIEIEADIVTDTEINYSNKQAIAAFSGGVDSCFTVWKNHKTKQYQLEAGIMVHGFDIPLTKKDMFDRAKEKSKLILDDLGLKLIPITTNIRDFNQDWEDIHGAALASCLMLFEKEYNLGLISSSLPYNTLELPWGSNPITDHLLSNNNFKIIHYGAGYNRLEKIRNIIDFTVGCDNLRVCWEGENLDKNCGQCEKCIRTILAFRSFKNQLIKCFEQDVNDSQILGINHLKYPEIIELKSILQQAKNSGISDSWVSALAQCIINNERRLFLKGIKQKIWQKFPQLEKLRSLLS